MIPPATPGGRGAITACRSAAIDHAAGTPCSIVRCVTRCMIRLRHDLKDGTTVADQNYRNQSGVTCAVRNVAAIIAKVAASAEAAVRSLGLCVLNAAPPTKRTKTSAADVALR